MECVCGRPRARDDDDKAALRDDAEAILLAAARDMQVEQSLAQQERKSKGHGGEDTTESDRLDDASARHADERVGSGFDINEVVSDYRALRASASGARAFRSPTSTTSTTSPALTSRSISRSPRPSAVTRSASIGLAKCSWRSSGTIYAIR